MFGRIRKFISDLMQEITDSKINKEFVYWLKSDMNKNGINDYLESD